MPRILHVTDLHVTGANETLDGIWTGAQGYLNRSGIHKFDFIVASGDLSQRASSSEYTSLLEFSEKRLLPLVGGQRPRIIFVPGNHDAQWDGDVFTKVALTDEPADRLRARVEQLRKSPAHGGARMCLGQHAHLELFDVKRDVYPSRFANVQQFLDSFYRGELAGPYSRPFDLVSDVGGEDWSCHFEQESQIAFLGFNSCRYNDRYWHGANVDYASVTAAQEHLTRLRRDHPNALVVAVWHHGFSSEIGRPDRLSLTDLGAFYNVGARLGFHGHTHIDDLKEHAFLHGKFVVVATGSLGAGDADRPPGVTNQFSIVELFPSRLRLTRVNRQHLAGTFEADGQVRRLRLEHGPVARAGAVNIAEHRRHWVVNEDGIARVSVELKGIQSSRAISLAVVNPPYCEVVAEHRADTERGPVTVAETLLSDNRVKFTVADVDGCDRLTWNYDVSNAVALSVEELELLPERKLWFPNIQSDEDVRSHTVREDCDVFELSIEFSVESTYPTSFRPLVERRTPDGTEYQWELDVVEQGRVELKSRAGGATLRVEAPIVGHRYSIVLKPPAQARPYPPEALSLLADVLEQCRGVSYLASSLRQELTAACQLAIIDAFPPGTQEIGAWVGFLWDQSKRRLSPCFGDFPAASWASRFRAGNAVAGHAFRHGRGVAWARRSQDSRGSTIYQSRTEQGDEHSVEYNWVLCIPLLVDLNGPAVGVVSFARAAHQGSPADRHIRELADAGEQIVHREDWQTLRTNLHAAFWTTLFDTTALTKRQRDYAEGCLKRTVNVD